MPTALPRPAAAALAALSLFAGTAARAEEWREIPYAELAKMPLTLAKVDPQHIFTTALMARPGKGLAALPADYKLQVKVGGQLVPVAVAPDGKVAMPFRQDWADAGAVIRTNQPKGRVLVSLSFDSRVPPGVRMSYAQLTEAAPVLERGIGEMAGFMSFMAPEVKSFTLSFDKPPQTVLITQPDGKSRSYKTDAKGQVVLPWEPKWAAAQVELSAPLKDIDQTLK
jgi:hypothetical protein